ncbi:hypothetical protein DA89_3345 [Vibrio paracholerae]|nr:hypothetical protein DA89_3345 [Vibrio paracholerae]
MPRAARLGDAIDCGCTLCQCNLMLMNYICEKRQLRSYGFQFGDDAEQAT